MALAKDLPVYEDTYQLVKEFTNVHKQMDKIYKPTLGNKLLDTSLNLFGHIECANRTMEQRQRSYHQTQFLILLETLKTLVRLCYEIRVVNGKKHAHLMFMLDSIGKQATAWKNK